MGATTKINVSRTDTLTNGLVGSWTFDGPDMAVDTAFDRSGNANNGTLTGGPVRTEGKIGQALNFDGVDDYVDLGEGAVMANAFVQEVEQIVFSGSSVSKSVPSVGAGNALVVGVYWDPSTVTLDSITDDRGEPQAYTLPGSTLSTGGAASRTGYNYNVTGGTTVVTANFSGAIAEAKIWVQEVSGPGTTDPLGQSDGSVDIFRNVTCTDCVSSPAVVTTTDGEYIAGFDISSGSPALNAGTGFTKRSASDQRGTTESQIQTSAGSIAATFSRTDTAGATAQVFIVTLKAAAAEAGPSLSTKSVSFWMKNATSTTQKMLDLNGTASISDVSGTITATNFTSPTIYVDGVVNSTVNDTAWHHVVVTTDTAITADAIKFGIIGSTYFGGSLDEVRVYNRALSVDEVKRLYNMGR